MNKIEELLETCPKCWAEIWDGNTSTCIDIDTVRDIMKEYADWYVAKTLTELFLHSESFQGKQILDLNKIKNMTTPEHD